MPSSGQRTRLGLEMRTSRSPFGPGTVMTTASLAMRPPYSPLTPLGLAAVRHGLLRRALPSGDHWRSSVRLFLAQPLGHSAEVRAIDEHACDAEGPASLREEMLDG